MNDNLNSIELSHTRNRSLDERDFDFDFGSPFNKINRKKSWNSTNNLTQENTIVNIMDHDNRLKKRSPTLKSNSSTDTDIIDIIDEETMLEYENIKKEQFIEHKLYINNLLGYFYYLFLTNIPIIIMNSAYHLSDIYPVDSFIFLYLSPIFYKLCFKNIFIYHYSKKNNIILFLIYPISFILGICIRILDTIPFFQKFVLNTTRFDYSSVGYVVLFWVLIIYLVGIFMNELYNSKYRVLNFAFLISSCLFMYFTINFYLKIRYIIHIHHYFVGFILHIVCQTKKSKISIINNAIGLGVFIEGISQWGFSPLYYSYMVN